MYRKHTIDKNYCISRINTATTSGPMIHKSHIGCLLNVRDNCGACNHSFVFSMVPANTSQADSHSNIDSKTNVTDFISETVLLW